MMRIILLLVLLQLSLFWVGLAETTTRARLLWGKSVEERRAVVNNIGAALTRIASHFPMDAKIYLIHPQGFLYMNAVYYFYPRFLTVTMTNRRYNTVQEFAEWNEIPSVDWLLANGFTHVLSFQNGQVRGWRVEPGLELK